jgi:hypothetical protein
MLNKDISFYQTPEAFILQSNNNILRVDRATSVITTPLTFDSTSASAPTTIYGVLGSTKLAHNTYLAVIKQVESVGILFGKHELLRIVAVDWVPYTKEQEGSDDSDDIKYLQLLKSVVDSKAFYFSYTYDVTRSVQNWYTSEKYSTEPYHKNADNHFFWNQYISQDFINAKADNWVIPVIRGFAEIQNISLGNGKSFKFALLSRLGKKRVGTRYNVRGLDKQGNAANYAETEQIIETDKELLSFMQLRGSIPLYWSQKANLKYKPKIKISAKEPATSGFQLHIKDQLNRYKNLILINLIDLKGSEKLLADAFETECKKFGNDQVRYISFDFHQKCKSMNYGAINELVTEVEKNVEDYGYFEYDIKTKTIKREQIGIARVNCIDCLDRTNVVENVFGLHVLTKQLRQLGLIGDSELVYDHKPVEKVFKNAWADNGDQMSNLYAGTGALKADFTRTGKRSLFGVYNDGMNSVTRYYLNNFSDGFKQDAVNLFLGKYIINPNEPSPFKATTTPVFSLLKYALFASLLMVAMNTSQIPSGM